MYNAVCKWFAFEKRYQYSIHVISFFKIFRSVNSVAGLCQRDDRTLSTCRQCSATIVKVLKD